MVKVIVLTCLLGVYSDGHLPRYVTQLGVQLFPAGPERRVTVQCGPPPPTILTGTVGAGASALLRMDDAVSCELPPNLLLTRT